MCDILVEIPDEDLPELFAFFEEKAPWAPYMKAFSGIAQKWKKQTEKYKNAMRFFSPNNSWREDGTVVITLRMGPEENIYVFTLENDCSNLLKGLLETKRLKHDLRTVFYAIHQKHIPTIKKYIEDKNLKLEVETPCYFYIMRPEEARKMTIECPVDVTVEKLPLSAADQINKVWPHRYPGSEEYIRGFLEANGGYGVFLKSSGKLVAWAVKQACGNFVMLQTEEEYKRNGYATLITKAIAKDIAEEGYYPFGTILMDNLNSIKMFKKLGFSPLAICSFFSLEQN